MPEAVPAVRRGRVRRARPWRTRATSTLVSSGAPACDIGLAVAVAAAFGAERAAVRASAASEAPPRLPGGGCVSSGRNGAPLCPSTNRP